MGAETDWAEKLVKSGETSDQTKKELTKKESVESKEEVIPVPQAFNGSNIVVDSLTD
jgi:hypothetical protein